MWLKNLRESGCRCLYWASLPKDWQEYPSITPSCPLRHFLIICREFLFLGKISFQNSSSRKYETISFDKYSPPLKVRKGKVGRWITLSINLEVHRSEDEVLLMPGRIKLFIFKNLFRIKNIFLIFPFFPFLVWRQMHLQQNLLELALRSHHQIPIGYIVLTNGPRQSFRMLFRLHLKNDDINFHLCFLAPRQPMFAPQLTKDSSETSFE